MERKITWEKYIDPLNTNLEEVETPGFADLHLHDANAIDNDLDEGQLSEKDVYGINRNKTIYTPFGLLTLTNTSLACSQFDFWIMHTNFPITYKIISILDSIDGVETTEVQTKYRIRIGFPKSGLFDLHQIKLEIQNKLLKLSYKSNAVVDAFIDTKYDTKIVDNINICKKKLMDNGKYWIMCILPNGNIDSKESWDEKEIQEQLTFYYDIKDMVSCDILIYSDYQK